MVWSSLLVQRGLWLWSLGRCWDGQSGEASRPTRAGAVLPAVSGKQISWATAGVTQMETKKKKKQNFPYLDKEPREAQADSPIQASCPGSFWAPSPDPCLSGLSPGSRQPCTPLPQSSGYIPFCMVRPGLWVPNLC